MTLDTWVLYFVKKQKMTLNTCVLKSKYGTNIQFPPNPSIFFKQNK